MYSRNTGPSQAKTLLNNFHPNRCAQGFALKIEINPEAMFSVIYLYKVELQSHFLELIQITEYRLCLYLRISNHWKERKRT